MKDPTKTNLAAKYAWNRTSPYILFIVFSVITFISKLCYDNFYLNSFAFTNFMPNQTFFLFKK
jgi:hypothetical protein